MKRALLCSLVGIVTVACGGDPFEESPPAEDRDAGSEDAAAPGEDAGPVPSDCFDVPTKFQETCAGSICHTGSSATGVDLVAPGIESRVVGVAAVCGGLLADPSRPEQSAIYTKLAGKTCGTQMPQGGRAYTAEELACVAEWISGLLPDDGDGDVGAGECKPGNKEDCYDGPAEAEGVGLCTRGQKTCQPNRTWGACEGSVLPKQDNCLTDEDEDCDGKKPECKSAWTRGINLVGSDTARAVATDSEGNVYATGDFEATINLGGSDLTNLDEKKDIFLVKYDQYGNHLWSQSFPNEGNQYGQALTVDADDNLVMLARIYTGLTLGDSSFTGQSDDVVIAKFAPDGAVLWSRHLGGRDSDRADRVAIDKDGNVLVAATFAGAVSFTEWDVPAIDNMQPPGDERNGGTDVVVYKLRGTDGKLLLAQAFGGYGDDYATGIGSDADGNIFLTGRFGCPVKDGMLLECGANADMLIGETSHVNQGLTDVFVAKLAPDGTPLWSKSYGDTGNDSSHELVVTPDGGVVLAGYFAGSLDFGGGELVSRGLRDLFVAKLDTAGEQVWALRTGDSDDQVVSDFEATSWASLALGSDGSLWYSTGANGALDFGLKKVVSTDKLDIFLLKFSDAGAFLTGGTFGGVGTQLSLDVALDPSDNPIMAGRFFGTGTLNFGASGSLKGGGSGDAFVTKIVP